MSRSVCSCWGKHAFRMQKLSNFVYSRILTVFDNCWMKKSKCVQFCLFEKSKFIHFLAIVNLLCLLLRLQRYVIFLIYANLFARKCGIKALFSLILWKNTWDSWDSWDTSNFAIVYQSVRLMFSNKKLSQVSQLSQESHAKFCMSFSLGLFLKT